MGYTKLFNEIVMSTVWQEPAHVRLVWITMLALKDRWHVVSASIPGLADAARVTLEECQEALERLSTPDPYSRSQEHDGKRIKPCDGGWIILNGEKYRNKMSLDERREYNRIKQREYREKNKDVKSCVQKSTKSAHTDTDTETDIKNKDLNQLAQKTFDMFWSAWPVGYKAKKKESFRVWKKEKLYLQFEFIFQDVKKRKKKHAKWLNGFVPNPTTYLRGELWNDEINEQDAGRVRPVASESRKEALRKYAD